LFSHLEEEQKVYIQLLRTEQVDSREFVIIGPSDPEAYTNQGTCYSSSEYH